MFGGGRDFVEATDGGVASTEGRLQEDGRKSRVDLERYPNRSTEQGFPKLNSPRVPSRKERWVNECLVGGIQV